MDDEKGITEGLKIIIEKGMPNCKVIGCAYNGSEGALRIMQYSPDIVLTDISMPILDGLDMIKDLKQKGCTSKFVIFSAYSEFEYAQRGIALGVEFYITKPIEEEELFDCLSKVMEDIKEKRLQSERYNELKNSYKAKEGFIDFKEMQGDSACNDIIGDIKAYIVANFAGNISLAELSKRFFLNPNYLSQLFKDKTGITYSNFLIQTRIDKAKELLKKTDLKVYEVCESIGYTDTNYFSQLFKTYTGYSPNEYKKISAS